MTPNASSGATLTERFFATFGLIQVVGILSLWRIEFLSVYLVLLIAMLFLTWKDWQGLAGESDYVLIARGPKNPTLSQTVKFNIELVPKSQRALNQSTVRILALRIEFFEFLKDSILWRGPDKPIEHPAHVLRLGHVLISRWPIAIVSPRGYFRKLVRLPIEPFETRVAPERRELSEQAFSQLLQSHPLLWQGARLRTRSQEPDQVLSIRKYQYPDPLRHIDQKKSARFNEPMTRSFDTLRNHHLVIALDIGRSMAGTIRQSAKVDYYLSAALALAQNAIESRDQVSFFAFSQTVHLTIERSRSLAAFRALFRSEQVLGVRDEESDYRLIPKQISRLTGSRAIVIILTDQSKPSVQEALLQAIVSVSSRHLTVITGLNDRELDLEDNVSSFRGLPEAKNFNSLYSDLLYSYWMRERSLLFKEKLARVGAGSLTVNDEHWMSTVERIYGVLRASRLA